MIGSRKWAAEIYDKTEQFAKLQFKLIVINAAVAELAEKNYIDRKIFKVTDSKSALVKLTSWEEAIFALEMDCLKALSSRIIKQLKTSLDARLSWDQRQHNSQQTCKIRK